jgi:hypothetical protein
VVRAATEKAGGRKQKHSCKAFTDWFEMERRDKRWKRFLFDSRCIVSEFLIDRLRNKINEFSFGPFPFFTSLCPSGTDVLSLAVLARKFNPEQNPGLDCGAHLRLDQA